MSAFQNDAFQNDAFQSVSGPTLHEGATASTAAATSSAAGTVLHGVAANAMAVATSSATLTPAVTIHEGETAATASATSSADGTAIVSGATSTFAVATTNATAVLVMGGHAINRHATATSNATGFLLMGGEATGAARASSVSDPSLVLGPVGDGSGGSGGYPPRRINIYYDGEDITVDCVITESRFVSRADGSAGQAEVVIRDDAQIHEFAPGKTLELFIDGRREWDGWATDLRRNYWFDGVAGMVPRKFKLVGADRNILFQRRVLYNKADPDLVVDNSWPAGTMDRAVILSSIEDFLELASDGINIDAKVEEVASVDPYQPFKLPGPGSYFGDLLRRVSSDVGGTIYYIDPDRFLVYTDVNEADAPFGLSDAPGSPSVVAVSDGFNRTVSGSWGTGSLGTFVDDGSGSRTLSVDGDHALVAFGTNFASLWNEVPMPVPDGTMTVTSRFQWGSSHSTSDTSLIELYENGYDHEHGAYVSFSGNLYLYGYITSPAYYADTDFELGAFSPNEWVTLVMGYDPATGTLRAKCWADGDAEPGWQVFLSDPLLEANPLDRMTIGFWKYSTPTPTVRWDDVTLSQTASGAAGLEIGCRELTILSDASHMVNDAMIWGAGLGSDEPVFAREQDATSIALHGRWQNENGFRQGVWKQESVDRIADSIVYGSPSSRRGHKDDAVSVTATIFEPGLRVGQKVPVTSTVHGYSDVVPLRESTITFVSPWAVKYDLRLSHEIDQPWSILDPWRPRRECESVSCEIVGAPSTITTCAYNEFTSLNGWIVSGSPSTSGSTLFLSGTASVRNAVGLIRNTSQSTYKMHFRSLNSTNGTQRINIYANYNNSFLGYVVASVTVNGTEPWVLSLGSSQHTAITYNGPAWQDETDYILEFEYVTSTSSRARLYEASGAVPDWQVSGAIYSVANVPMYLAILSNLDAGSAFQWQIDRIEVCGEGALSDPLWLNTEADAWLVEHGSQSGNTALTQSSPSDFLSDAYGSWPVDRRQWQARVTYPSGVRWIKIQEGTWIYAGGFNQPAGPYSDDRYPTGSLLPFELVHTDVGQPWPPLAAFDPPGTPFYSGTIVTTASGGDYHLITSDILISVPNGSTSTQMYLRRTTGSPYGTVAKFNDSGPTQYLVPGSIGEDWILSLAEQQHVMEPERVCYPIPTCGPACVEPILEYCDATGCYYRATIPYIPGSTTLYQDGVLLQQGVDYIEYDPATGRIKILCESGGAGPCIETFTRVETGKWGTSEIIRPSTGLNYVWSGSASSLSVDGSKGIISAGTVAGLNLLASEVTWPLEVLVRGTVRMQRNSFGQTGLGAMAIRFTRSSDIVTLSVSYSSGTGSQTLLMGSLDTQYGGVQTNPTWLIQDIGSGGANELVEREIQLRLRFDVTGTFGKAWRLAAGEPGGWNASNPASPAVMANLNAVKQSGPDQWFDEIEIVEGLNCPPPEPCEPGPERLNLCFDGAGQAAVSSPLLLPDTATDGKFILPVSGSITAAFGPQGSAVWGSAVWHGTYYSSFHNGVDFGVGSGTPVYAAAGGYVSHETQLAGGTMIHIYHPNGMRTTYAHLSSRVAALGSTVAQGALIGYSGSTGNVTGPHLHWGLVINGSPEDPMRYT